MCLMIDYNEAPGEIDLRALAQDGESSIHALSEEENACFQDVFNHYEPTIKAAGIANIMDRQFRSEVQRSC